MAFVNISAAYTADPNDVWTPKNSFLLNDPFSIVLHVQADSSLVSKKMLFDAVVQIVGPQQDLTQFPWWIIDSDGHVEPSPTRDSTWTNQSFEWGTDFAFFVFWNSYFDAIAHVGNAKQGVFYVQGTVNVQESELFAASDRFWFKVRA
jgi:hypothetical protein